MTNETGQGMERLSWLPDRDATENGLFIAGQKYYDVFFSGGSITGITPSGLPTPLAIIDGGTGQPTANAALNALLPSQTGNAGKALKTDGTNTSWSTDTDTGITQLTGDVTAGPGSGSQAATLATVNGNVGSFGSSTSIPTFTANAKGLITAASGNAVVAPAGTLTGATLAAGVTASSLTSVGTLVNLTVTNPITGSITGNAATVTTNANLTGPITSSGNATSITSGNTYPTPTFSGTATPLGLVNISGASAGQIQFPASQNASANANTLDDYEEGVFTPVLSFVTPGNLSVVYNTQTAFYTKIGRQVTVSVAIDTSTFTHTTASGQMLISGVPFTALGTPNNRATGAVVFTGITKASYTQVSCIIEAGQSVITFQASASAQPVSNVVATDMPTGGTVQLFLTITYFTA